MLAVHLESGEVTVREVGQPIASAGFALIRLLAAGICNTDLELQRGYYGFLGIPGHEFVGEYLGRRVVGQINLGCGVCDFCKAGLVRHCANRTVLGIVKHPGAFAEYLTLPEENLQFLPDEISNEHAIFVEPLAAACEILDQVPIGPGDSVAVLGDGKLGLLITQVLLAQGARVVIFGHHEQKLNLARGWGAEIGSSESGFHFVVDCTGSQSGLATAVQMVRPRGTIVMKSTVHEKVQIDTAPIIVNEITLVGSRCGRFEPAIDLLKSGKVDVSRMISAEFPLREAPEAFAKAAQKGVLKVLLRP